MSKYSYRNGRNTLAKQRLYSFPNGYRVSVIAGEFGNGGKGELWEVAVIDRTGRICYDTPVTNHATKKLTDVELEIVLDRISQFPADVD